MLIELEQQILELQTLMAEEHQIQRKLNNVMDEHARVSLNESKLKEKLNKEELDVKKLESLTFVSVWSSLLGTKTEKLNNERNEAELALHEYRQVHDILQQLEQEISDYKQKLSIINEHKRKLDQLLIEKEKQVIILNNDNSMKLNEFNNRIVQVEVQAKELEEALAAGKTLLKSFLKIEEVLQKARGWGNWDLFGGGLLSDIMKHDQLDKAERYIEDARYQANKFNRELNDVKLSFDITINIDHSLRFFDFFFDGIFSNLAVQDKINRAIDQTMVERDKVSSVLEHLLTELNSQYALLDQIKTDKKQLLMTCETHS
jgi:hypothetical protein